MGKVMRPFDPPHAVEVLVFEVRADALDRWIEADHEHWTLPESERFPFYAGKEVWMSPGEGWHTVTIVIHWSDEEAWRAIDPTWIEEQQRRFDEVVGADTYRLIRGPHEAGPTFRVSEYR